MKYLLLAILMFVAGESWGQIERDTTVSLKRDTTFLTTYTDTLAIKKITRKLSYVETEAEFRFTKAPTKNLYRLVIRFHTTDVCSITSDYSALFTFINGTSLSLPYDGKVNIYSSNEFASYSLNIAKYLDVFKNNPIKKIELGTSTGSYTVPLEGRFQEKIANMIKTVLNS